MGIKALGTGTTHHRAVTRPRTLKDGLQERRLFAAAAWSTCLKQRYRIPESRAHLRGE